MGIFRPKRIYSWPSLHEWLTSIFHATTGHTHDGTEGNGGPIGASGIAAGAIHADELAENAVETAKIKDLAVTEGKLAAAVQSKLNTTDAANAAAIGTIANLETEATDLVEAVNEVKVTADAAYVKPETGIPSIDMAAAVGTSLGKADSALQPADGLVSGSFTTTEGTFTVVNGQITAFTPAGG